MNLTKFIHIHCYQHSCDNTIFIGWVLEHSLKKQKNKKFKFFPIKTVGGRFECDWNHHYCYDCFLGIWIELFILWANGQWLTSRYEAFSVELCKCNWYSLSIEMQRLYFMFLLNTERRIHIHSYGGIVCSRETCKKVTATTFNGNFSVLGIVWSIFCIPIFR